LIGGIAAVVVIILVIVLVLVTKKPANQATVAASNLPPNKTLQQFQRQIKDQLLEPEPGGFAVTGVNEVDCNMTQVWNVGNRFKCFAYDSTGNEIGAVDGTIEPSTPSHPDNANLGWTPDPGYSGNTGNTGLGNTGNTGNTGHTGLGNTGNTGTGTG
jgi:hypothetical protein